MPPKVVTTAFSNLGHMSLYSGCYAAGCVLLVMMALEFPMDWSAVAAALATTWFIYLLHRIRVARTPGVAWSQRILYYGRNRKLVRVALWGSGAASFVALLFVQPWACLLIPASICGMLFYSHGSNGKRVRDRFILKNAMVALSMAMFCMVLAFLGAGTVPGGDPTVLFVLFVLFLVILSDAILCDFADIEVDKQTLTRTVPVQLGNGRAWMVADSILLGSGLVLVFLWWSGSVPGIVGLGIPFLMVSTQFLLRCFKAEQLRHAVDLRLPIAVTVVFLVLTCINPSI